MSRIHEAEDGDEKVRKYWQDLGLISAPEIRRRGLKLLKQAEEIQSRKKLFGLVSLPDVGLVERPDIDQ